MRMTNQKRKRERRLLQRIKRNLSREGLVAVVLEQAVKKIAMTMQARKAKRKTVTKMAKPEKKKRTTTLETYSHVSVSLPTRKKRPTNFSRSTAVVRLEL